MATEFHIGFTGTRQGMTNRQRLAFTLLTTDIIGVFHHGDCIGADAEAHLLASDAFQRIVIHPPTDKKYAANILENDHVCRLSPRAYLDRNHDIVDACALVIAAPMTMNEQPRSGTWATVRYARSTQTPVIILDR